MNVLQATSYRILEIGADVYLNYLYSVNVAS